jgi:hypothetical protein
MINEALKQYLEKSGGTLNEAVIRRVIREKLDKSAVH